MTNNKASQATHQLGKDNGKDYTHLKTRSDEYMLSFVA
jgi:hypothetical protein